MIPSNRCFCPIVSSKANAPSAAPRISTAIRAKACGAAYAPTELKNPYSAVSGAEPVKKSSEHYFFSLSDARCSDFLRAWTREGDHLQPEAANKMHEWLGEAGENKLSDWDISRDAPYFGFEIPDARGKYFYVWLDAPIGYMGSFKISVSGKIFHSMRFGNRDYRRIPSSIISSARIFYIFTPCSGRQC